MKKSTNLARWAIPGCLLFSLAVSPAMALDLTPHFAENLSPGGVLVKRLYFADGAKKYTVAPGPGTTLSGDANGATFSFGELDGATLVIKLSPYSPDLLFEGDALETYRKALAAYLPPGTTESVVEKEISNPFPINDWKAHTFILSCKMPGATLRQSVTFLNMTEKQQVVLVVTAYGQAFGEALARSSRIIRSWSLLPDSALTTPVAN